MSIWKQLKRLAGWVVVFILSCLIISSLPIFYSVIFVLAANCLLLWIKKPSAAMIEKIKAANLEEQLTSDLLDDTYEEDDSRKRHDWL